MQLIAAVSGVCDSSKAPNKILVSGSAGVISKLIQPPRHLRNIDCTWIITAPTGKHIKLTFLGKFNLGVRCYKKTAMTDYVQIRDGPLTTSPSLGKFCGTLIPAPVETSGPFAVVHLKSRGVHSDGFYAMYEATDRGKVNTRFHCPALSLRWYFPPLPSQEGCCINLFP